MARRVFRRLLFSAVAFVLVALATEAAARMVEPSLTARTMPLPFPNHSPDRAFEQKVAQARAAAGDAVPMVYDDAAGWTLPPSRTERYGTTTLRFNALGMRGPDWPPHQAGTVRLMTLGDSSIFGLGVMESQVFSSVAAADLTRRWGVPVEGVIGGVPGYDTSQARALQAKVERTLDPDWVVIGTLWSDVMAGDSAPTLSAPSPLATYRVATVLLSPWLAARRVKFLDKTTHVSGGAHPPRTSLPDYVANLRALATTAQADGAKTAFILLPAPLDLDPVPPPEAVATYREAMRMVAEETGSPLVDGVEVARARGADLSWWSDQVHPSTRGHQELGVALADTLAAQGPAPTGP